MVEAGAIIHETQIIAQVSLACVSKIGLRDGARILPHLTEGQIPLFAHDCTC
jgi:hypothetical protein